MVTHSFSPILTVSFWTVNEILDDESKRVWYDKKNQKRSGNYGTNSLV